MSSEEWSLNGQDVKVHAHYHVQTQISLLTDDGVHVGEPHDGAILYLLSVPRSPSRSEVGDEMACGLVIQGDDVAGQEFSFPLMNHDELGNEVDTCGVSFTSQLEPCGGAIRIRDQIVVSFEDFSPESDSSESDSD